jgi:hypothetical protein
MFKGHVDLLVMTESSRLYSALLGFTWFCSGSLKTNELLYSILRITYSIVLYAIYCILSSGNKDKPLVFTNARLACWANCRYMVACWMAYET